MWRRVEQFKQVGITYLTHRWTLLITLGVVVVAVPNLMLAMSGKPAAERAPVMLFLVGFPMLFGMMFLVMQAKAQFAHCRARLIPDFFPPHLIVLGAVLLGLVLVYPVLIAWAARFDPLGLIAVSLAIAAPYVWSVHTGRPAWMLVSMVAFLSLMTEWGLRWWILDAPSYRLANSIIAGCGAALLVAWMWRLSRLREEMDDYQMAALWGGVRKAGTELPEQRRLVAAQMSRYRFISWVGDAWLNRLGGYHGHRRTRLARLLRYGFGAVPTELHAFVIVVLLMIPAILLGQLSYIPDKSGLGAFLVPVQFAFLMPGLIVGQHLARRRSRLAGELLFPLSRREWVDGLLVASARIGIVWWLMLNAGLICVAWPIVGDRLTPAIVAMFLLFSAATALVLFGIALRTSFWDSMAMRTGVLVVALVALTILVAGWCGLRDHYGDRPFVALALVLAALGAWLVVAARRAWLKLELGR
jgi:hypothetical protein